LVRTSVKFCQEIHPMTRVFLDLIKRPVNFKDNSIQQELSKKMPFKLFSDDPKIEYLESQLSALENDVEHPILAQWIPKNYVPQDPDWNWLKSEVHPNFHGWLDQKKSEYDTRVAEIKNSQLGQEALDRYEQVIRVTMNRKFWEIEEYSKEVGKEQKRTVVEMKTILHNMKYAEFITAEQVVDTYPDSGELLETIERNIDDSNYELPEIDLDALWLRAANGKTWEEHSKEVTETVSQFNPIVENNFGKTIEEFSEFVKNKQDEYEKMQKV